MIDAPVPERGYAFVEGLHLRQWLLRAVLPLAALTTNGAGAWHAMWLPSHDALYDSLELEAALRATGAAAVLVAAVLRVLAKGVLVRKSTLTTGGVYRIVRHPFYLANLAGALGMFFLAGTLGALVGLVWVAVAIPVYALTIAGEERALARLFPEAFRAYAATVRALVPGLPRRGAPAASVTWANLVAEREPPRLVRFLAGALLVFGLTLHGAAANVALAVAALAFGLSYGLRG